MNFIKTNISTILTAVFVIIVVLMFYAPMYAYQEGLQIFMFNGEFFADTCLRPGGFSDYIGCFLVQFFMYPHWTTIILTLCVVGIQMITKSIFVCNGCDDRNSEILSIICAAGMAASTIEFSVMFGGCIAVLIAVAASKLLDIKCNKTIFCVATPIIYWIAGGWCCIIFIVALTVKSLKQKDFVFPAINIVLLLFSWLIIKHIMQDDSLYGTFTGVDFNRNPEINCPVWFVSITLIITCIIISSIKVPRPPKALRIAAYVATAGALTLFTLTKYNADAILFYKIDRMARYKQWNNIVSTMGKVKTAPQNMAQCYLNLALNELGEMDKRMFDFAQTGTKGLISPVINSQDKCICNSEIYFRLGLTNISERLTAEAMESINTGQKSARLYKRLAECALLKGDIALAMKYLKKLQATIFYRAWAIRAEQYINDPAHTEALADWKIRPLEMSNDVFYTPSTGDFFLYNLLYNNPRNQKVFNYFMAYLLLDKNISKIYNVLSQGSIQDDILGKNIHEATILHLYLHDKEEYNKISTRNDDLTTQFRNFCNFMDSGGAQNPQKAKELFGNTYWYWYYYYCN